MAKKRTIRLWSIATPFGQVASKLGCQNTQKFLKFVQNAVGSDYRVTTDNRLLNAAEDDDRGGRTDDAARAREIEKTLADDSVAAAVALRGGAWLIRILPRIDFSVLKRRKRRIALFGFSEIAPLINIASQYESVVAYHDLCPAFLLPGMIFHAREDVERLYGEQMAADEAMAFGRGWAMGKFRSEFAEFFRDAVSMLEGRGSSREVSGCLVGGSLTRAKRVSVVGGNLTTIVPLLNSPFAGAIEPAKGRWLLIEDWRESPDRIDRLLSHFSLSGQLSRYEGFIVGTFREPDGDCAEAAVRALKRHLGSAQPPIILTGDIGHQYPMSPLPINRALTIHPELKKPGTRRRISIRPNWPELAFSN